MFACLNPSASASPGSVSLRSVTFMLVATFTVISRFEQSDLAVISWTDLD